MHSHVDYRSIICDICSLTTFSMFISMWAGFVVDLRKRPGLWYLDLSEGEFVDV